MGWLFFAVTLVLLILSRVEIYYLDKAVKALEEIVQIRGERIDNLNKAYDSLYAKFGEALDMMGRAIEAIKPVISVTDKSGGGV
jgi:hypothetical protein